MKKFQPFSKCCRPQNSPLLSGLVAFPDFSKIEGRLEKIMLPPIGKVLNNTRVVTPNTRQCFLRAAAECWIIPIAGV